MKKIFSVLALFLLIGGGLSAYAYWDTLTTSSDETVEIGEGTTLEFTETLEPEEGSTLVPSDVVMKEGDVEEIVFEYSVSLDQEPLEDLDFEANVSNVLIGGETEDSNLVNVDVQSPNLIGSDDINVVITVTLDEPSDEDQYDRIVNETITFDIEFSASIQE